jgi:hypothetical protein
MSSFVFGPDGITGGSGNFEIPGFSGTDESGQMKLPRYKEFYHGNASSFTRSFHVANDFGQSFQGGCCMYMMGGWQARQSYGYVQWINAGGAGGITTVRLHEAYNNGVTLAMTTDGNSTITFNVSSSHVNGHGFHFVVWTGQ